MLPGFTPGWSEVRVHFLKSLSPDRSQGSGEEHLGPGGNKQVSTWFMVLGRLNLFIKKNTSKYFNRIKKCVIPHNCCSDVNATRTVHPCSRDYGPLLIWCSLQLCGGCLSLLQLMISLSSSRGQHPISPLGNNLSFLLCPCIRIGQCDLS